MTDMVDFIHYAIQDWNVDKIKEHSFNSKLIMRFYNSGAFDQIESFLKLYIQTPEIHSNFTWFIEDVEKLEMIYKTISFSCIKKNGLQKCKAKRKLF